MTKVDGGGGIIALIFLSRDRLLIRLCLNPLRNIAVPHRLPQEERSSVKKDSAAEKERKMLYPRVKNEVEIPAETPDGTLFVSVAESFGKVAGASLEDCARGYWTVRHMKAAHGFDCKYLVARRNGVIEGVWKIDLKKGWMKPEDTPKKTWPDDRPKGKDCVGCGLIRDEKLESKLVGKRVKLGACPNHLRGYFK